MANVLLGVTGSVAAVRTPVLFEELVKAGHEVKVVATQAALYFFDPATLAPHDRSYPARNKEVVYLDADEWPGREWGQRYERDDVVLHIELRRWADVLVIAPLDANTLAKMTNGLADNCLMCVWRSWDFTRPIVLAPAMNTLMWDNPLTHRHLRQLVELTLDGAIDLPPGTDAIIEWLNKQTQTPYIVAPQSKRLACGDVGLGAMAEVNDIVAAVNSRCRAPARR